MDSQIKLYKMMKTDFAKYPDFFSARNVEPLEDKLIESPVSLSQSQRLSQKTLPTRNSLTTRVSEFLTRRKLGLVTNDNTSQLKALKKFSEGGNQNHEMRAYLQNIKKEFDDCVNSCLEMQKQIDRMTQLVKVTHNKNEELSDTNRFTEENYVSKSRIFEDLSAKIETCKYQAGIFEHIMKRTKTTADYQKAKVNRLRSQTMTTNFKQTQNIDTSNIYKKQIATQEYKKQVKRSSLQINHHLKLAKQTLESKTNIIKAVKQAEEFREKVAKQYELKYLSENKQKRELLCHLLVKNMLNRKYFRIQNEKAFIEMAFRRLKNKTAITDPNEFKNAYFNSFDTYKQLNIKVVELEKKQSELQNRNKILSENYRIKVLELQSQQKSLESLEGTSQMKQQQIQRAQETMAKINLWTTRLSSLLQQDQARQPDTAIKQIMRQAKHLLQE